jgi:trans-L-3-hydroxyproline dehydratase
MGALKMTDCLQVRTLDYHTAGEPLRIVTGGLPDIPGGTMLEKRSYMASELDHFRRLLMLEPRGHADMYGAVLTDPVTGDGDVGVLFLHNEGYSTMCGHGIIALVTAGLEQRLFDIADPQAIRIDSPAGRITARANRDGSGKVASVAFNNVPSFVLEPDCSVDVDGVQVNACIAFGGAFYAYVDAELHGFGIEVREASRLIEFGRRIKQVVTARYPIRHPDGDTELGFLYGTIFVRQCEEPHRSRNACIFADGELDRSPTGTGVSGRAAIHYARGEIGLDEPLEIESIIGTQFMVRCLEETTVGGLPAVITEVTGSAHITGEHRFTLDPADPLADGFLLR